MIRLMKAFYGQGTAGTRRSAVADRSTQEMAFRLLQDAARWFHEFMVIVEVPGSSLRDLTSIVRIEYSEAVPRKAIQYLRRPVPPAVESGTERISRWWANLKSTTTKIVAGSYSSTLRIPVRCNVGTSSSSHLSLVAPEGVRIIDAKVMVDYGTFRPRIRVNYPNDALVPELAHVYVEHQPTRVHHAEFRASLYAYKSGFPVQASVASVILLAMVAVTWWRVSLVNYTFSNSSTSALAQDSTTLVLLIVPAIVAAVVQTDGHRATSRCLHVPRALLSMSIIAVLGTAGLTAFGAHGFVAEDGWRAALIVTALVALRLNLSFINQWHRTSHRQALKLREQGLSNMDREMEVLQAFQLNPATADGAIA
jgi:hypothetical protein